MNAEIESQDIKKLEDLIKDIRIAMLVTRGTQSPFHARPMATQELQEDGNLWFFTSSASPKMSEIYQDEHVTVIYSEPKDQCYVSVYGRATEVNDSAKKKELWKPAFKAWFPEGLEDPNLTLLKVEIDMAEYWDSPSGAVVQMLGFAKAAITGKKYSGGEHGKINLNPN